MDKAWSVEEIRNRLATNDKWLERGLVAIYRFQTESEKNLGATVEDNGVGFNGVDSVILTSFAQQLSHRGFLTPKQREIARKKMLKYARQLTKIANGELN